MKQNFFDEIDSGWDELISDVYNDKYVFKPDYEIIDGKKYLNKQYTDTNIDSEKELILDDDLYEINTSVFFDCTNLISILDIPDSVEYIGNSAFEYCSGFTSLKLSNSLKKIGDWSFGKCTGFTGELIIPDSVEEIGSGAFECCSGFTSLKLPKNLKNVSSWTFENCTGLTGDLIIPKTIKYIGQDAFKNCNFNKIYAPKQYINYYSIYWNYDCNAEIIEY